MSQAGPVPVDTAGPSPRAARIHAHPYRRWALQRLATLHGPLHLADLARDLASLASQADESTDAAEDPRAVYVALYHNHLPRLAERDAIAFDADSKVSSLRPRGDELASSLQDDRTEGRSHS
jgi:hypothetical protein